MQCPLKTEKIAYWKSGGLGTLRPQHWLSPLRWAAWGTELSLTHASMNCWFLQRRHSISVASNECKGFCGLGNWKCQAPEIRRVDWFVVTTKNACFRFSGVTFEWMDFMLLMNSYSVPYVTLDFVITHNWTNGLWFKVVSNPIYSKVEWL